MDPKKYLLWTGVGFLVILSAFVLVSTNQQLNTATTSNTVSFTGEGKVSTLPDVAMLDLAIVTEAPTSKAAQDDNSAKSQKLTAYLKGQGIDEKDIKTTSYNIYPQYNYPPNGKPEINGYQVNQMMKITIRNLDKRNAILDGVVTAGVNQINNFQLVVEKPDELKAKAREAAIKDAETKAKELRNQLGIRLGRIINFSESGNGVPPPIYYDKVMASEGRGGGGPDIPVGENEIVVNVNITYQIK
ncbi:MAG: SIMPL domain-containing protein [Candidatus Yanofskybacteria bacterium]|nr:SIMPL domain-containing protein [Candidatus Yanofskybacteria bacterium]